MFRLFLMGGLILWLGVGWRGRRGRGGGLARGIGGRQGGVETSVVGGVGGGLLL